MEDNVRRIWVAAIWAVALIFISFTVSYQAKEAIIKLHSQPQLVTVQHWVWPSNGANDSQ